MNKEKIDRINFLARKSRSEGLTEEEKEEQQALRGEYILEFRAQFSGMLHNTVVQYPDGSRKTLDELKSKK